MKINQCDIENFTVFDRQRFEFCDGINVVIGANGTGKSHLLKLLYVLTKCSAIGKLGVTHKNEKSVSHSPATLAGIFKPENGDVRTLKRKQKESSISEISIIAGSETHSVRVCGNMKDGDTYIGDISSHSVDNNAIFIPPNEVLAIYPGFAASYEKRELAFDQTYYDLCKALSAAPLKVKHIVFSRLVPIFEDILQGKVVQKGDRFYVQKKKAEKLLEAHLLAEGHRKIATIVHLINNGAIDKQTILFWDEPEANLNPILIKHIALFLRELARIGIQVFIATHDYLLTGELSLAVEYHTQPEVPIRFFAMSRNGDNPVEVQSGNTLADLQNNPILDEFAAHYTREQDAAIQLMKG